MDISSVTGSLAALPAQTQGTAPGGTTRAASSPAVAATGDTGTSTAKTAKPTLDQVQHALEQVQKVVRPLAQSLQFSIDKDSHEPVVKIIDTETNKVIRQIPSEEMLDLAKSLDKFAGLLMKQKA